MYASGTVVSSDRSKNEIESILRKYGADQFISGWGQGQVVIGFRMGQRMIRFNLPIPSPETFKTFKTRGGWNRSRTDSAAEAAFEQELRRRWRALALVIKAKLEAVESKITSFEEEFLAHIVLPGGRTVWETSRHEIKLAYESQKTPGSLLGWSGGEKEGS